RPAAVRPAPGGAGLRGGRGDAALGLANAGTAHAGVRGGLCGAPRRTPRGRALELHGGAAPRVPGGGGGTGRRGDRALIHVRGDGGGGPVLRRAPGIRG